MPVVTLRHSRLSGCECSSKEKPNSTCLSADMVRLSSNPSKVTTLSIASTRSSHFLHPGKRGGAVSEESQHIADLCDEPTTTHQQSRNVKRNQDQQILIYLLGRNEPIFWYSECKFAVFSWEVSVHGIAK
jgi:hypothetical protein